MKDIAQYINFSQNKDKLPKRSIQSLLNLPCIVHSWQYFDSIYRDSNPNNRYVQLHVEVDAGHYMVNTGSTIIMEQLSQIEQAKEQANDTEQGFTCIMKRAGRGIKMFPIDWDRKDVSA